MTPRKTKSQARLQLVHKTKSDTHYNWLFLPGGPGLGSESLNGLATLANLPGSSWHLDLPGDGSNTTGDDANAFSHWSEALIEAASEFEKVILVAHSSGGMFALATPELEKIISGLVLMDSAPSAAWQNDFSKYVHNHPLPEAERLQTLYDKNPSNDILKKLTIACAPYFSRPESLQKITALMQSLPFNYQSHLWAAQHFDATYTAKWAPQTIPTLIFAGDQDPITPLKLFIKSEPFQRKNITIEFIKNASHFPWIDNPKAVATLLTTFYGQL